MKISWRQILESWKKESACGGASVPKDRFPSLLKKLFDTLKKENVQSGFKKCGIFPLCRNKVLDMLPKIECNSAMQIESTVQHIDDSFKELLQSLRQYDKPKSNRKRSKIDVTPGKSIEVKDLDTLVTADTQPSTSGDQTKPRERLNKKAQANVGNPKIKKKKYHNDYTTDENSDYSLQDSDEDFQLSTTSEEEPDFGEQQGPSQIPKVFSSGDFVVVRVYGKKKTIHRLYVSRVLYAEDDGYVGVFYKKAPGTRRFLETKEDGFFKVQDILQTLTPSTDTQTSERFKNMVTFSNDMEDVVLY